MHSLITVAFGGCEAGWIDLCAHFEPELVHNCLLFLHRYVQKQEARTFEWEAMPNVLFDIKGPFPTTFPDPIAIWCVCLCACGGSL